MHLSSWTTQARICASKRMASSGQAAAQSASRHCRQYCAVTSPSANKSMLMRTCAREGALVPVCRSEHTTTHDIQLLHLTLSHSMWIGNVIMDVVTLSSNLAGKSGSCHFAAEGRYTGDLRTTKPRAWRAVAWRCLRDPPDRTYRARDYLTRVYTSTVLFRLLLQVIVSPSTFMPALRACPAISIDTC